MIKVFKGWKPPKFDPLASLKPIAHGVSNEELDMLSVIRSEVPETSIIRGDRTILDGREIDIYLPSYKVGFEYNGIFYHNSSSKSELYHLDKTIKANKKGVKLIHIFSNYWESKRSLVVDLIQKALGKYQILDGYKDCTLERISIREGREFLENTHLQSFDSEATIYFGFIYNGNIVEVVSLIDKNDYFEITRIGERRTLKIANDIQRILEVFRPHKVILKLDRSMFYPDSFTLENSKELTPTNPNTYFTKDCKSLHKEIPLHEKKEEYKKVYDCGERLFEFTNQA